MKTNIQRIEALVQEFNNLANWEDRYKRLIEIGKALPQMDPSLQIEDNKIKGCQSQVWLSVKLNSDKTLHFEADSDAMIVKGLIALLLVVYQDTAPKDILEISTQFIKELGFESYLSPSRANGLQAMIRQIQYYATAYQYLVSQT